MNDTKNEPRYAGTNWDPEIKTKLNSSSRTPTRKVLTRGKKVLSSRGLFEGISKYLRMGYEVYIEDKIRFYPLVDKEMTEMIVSAQTLGEFRASLADKHFKITHCGKQIDAEDMVQKAKKHHLDAHEVTPDTMVSCPNCGECFRVGRRIVNS